jgi:hypothetical protein
MVSVLSKSGFVYGDSGVISGGTSRGGIPGSLGVDAVLVFSILGGGGGAGTFTAVTVYEIELDSTGKLPVAMSGTTTMMARRSTSAIMVSTTL